MKIPSQLLLSDFLNHTVRCDKGIEHGQGISVWMHPPVHRILGWISRPSNFKLERQVWRLDQLKGINQHEVYVKGDYSISDEQTLQRFPSLMNACVFNKHGQKIGLIADLIFEPTQGNIKFYLVSRSNPLIPGSSRWRLDISKIIDKQPGSISCDFSTFEDLPIYKASLKEELLNKGRKWKTQFQDFTYKASDKLEGWIDEQISQEEREDRDQSYIYEENNYRSNDWIDSLDVDSSKENNRMNEYNEEKNSTNERDLDPWI